MGRFIDFFKQHKFVLSSLLIFLLLTFLIVTYVATQQQQTSQSEAASNNCVGGVSYFECSNCRCVRKKSALPVCDTEARRRMLSRAAGSETCANALREGVFCDDPKPPAMNTHSVGSIVSLTANPTSGINPLNVTLTAYFKTSPDLLKQTLTAGKEYEYNFWWNCTADARVGADTRMTIENTKRDAHSSLTMEELIANLEHQCGILPSSPSLGSCTTNAFGARCKTTATQQTVTHIYQTTGVWQVPRVFVNVPGYSVILWNSEGGLQSPPDATAKIYTSCGANPTPSPTPRTSRSGHQETVTITPARHR
jgi:hypothetical protein